jgi:exodeoxyribonuclease V beta subunit
MNTFDYTSVALTGAHLIEASAGTGKTYSIAGLYLRLIVEKDLPVDRILVVTFTDAATGELRDRIRQRLVEAREAFSLPSAESMTEAMKTNAYLAKCFQEKDAAWRAAAVTRADAAVKTFDEAAISTIHSFCQRILRENAFEYSSLFNAELLADQSALLDEIARDFCRTALFSKLPPECALMFKDSLLGGSLVKIMKNASAKPLSLIIPDGSASSGELLACMKEVKKLFAECSAFWQRDGESIRSLLNSVKGWHANFNVDARLDDVESLIEEEDPFASPGNADVFGTGKLREKLTKANKSDFKEHQFFDLWENWCSANANYSIIYNRFIALLQSEFIRFAKDQLEKRKEARNIWSFDDLLSRVYRGIAGKNAKGIVDAVRAKFSAALIDEFQDTDPMQCGIFEEIFNNSESLLFYIGDPKQAIYNFRGADIFAYSAAKAKVSSRFALDTNRRSSKSLLDAVNVIFDRNDPFLNESISFNKAEPAPDAKIITESGAEAAACVVWTLESEDPSKAFSVSRAQAAISESVAAEIVSLLNRSAKGEILIGGRMIRPGDIAVLVEKNMQSSGIRQALSSRGVPVVSSDRDSIYQSREFYELELVLRGVLEIALVPAGCITSIYGLTAAELDCRRCDDETWNQVLEQFIRWRSVWEKEGFMRLFRALLTEREVRERIVSFGDGLRRVTNLMHCGEILHRVSVERGLAMQGLIQWMENVRTGTLDEYESELRLETDDDAVRITTIHRSKGLEYPIVFVPFSWGGSAVKNGQPLHYHEGSRQIIDLSAKDEEGYGEKQKRAEFEIMGEKLRLLYVALTRAKYRFYLVASKIGVGSSGYAASSIGYLFHNEAVTKEEGVSALKEKIKNLSHQDIKAAIEEKLSVLGTGCCVTKPAEGRDSYTGDGGVLSADLSPRTFGTVLHDDWKISSFSYLVAGSSSVYHDRRDAEGDDSDLRSDPEFPSGAKEGNCLHSIFESISFFDSRAEIEKKSAVQLDLYGIDRIYLPGAVSLVESTLSSELPGGGGVLKTICDKSVLKELEFYFPAADISAKGVKKLFLSESVSMNGGCNDAIRTLEFQSFSGFLKGYIDCIFERDGRYYIVDWKSNNLGSSAAQYTGSALYSVMDSHLYTLQCHIYALALHRYLSVRKKDYSYEKHFGGVYYLFLRGFRWKENNAGIWHHRPEHSFMEKMESFFIRTDRVVAACC